MNIYKRILSLIISQIMFLAISLNIRAAEILKYNTHIHTYESIATEPTCTERGYTTYTCECGESYIGNYVDATGEHTFGEWFVSIEPTLTEDGVECR